MPKHFQIGQEAWHKQHKHTQAQCGNHGVAKILSHQAQIYHLQSETKNQKTKKQELTEHEKKKTLTCNPLTEKKNRSLLIIKCE